MRYALAFVLLAAAFGARAQVAPDTQLPPQIPTQAIPLGPQAPRPVSLPPQPAPVLPEAAPGSQPFDYSVNLKSDVFGANLFTGAFMRSSAAIFNPEHVVTVGDQLQVRLWGAFDFDALLTVDAQGNIFMPQVGPIRVAGVANRNLPRQLEESLRKVFRANVYSYISLAAAQPVRVFVTGFVYRPGMYHGTSSDSVLRYLDQAGGIDAERGSFLEVQVLRGAQTRATVNLYDFLLTGRIAPLQIGDGDVVVVQPRKSTFRVGGLADNAKRFEFTGSEIALSQLVALAKPRPIATHVRVIRNTGVVRNVEYFALGETKAVQLTNGDEVEFTSDRRPGTITVRVEGEHLSRQEYVLPHGSRVGDLVKQIQFTERSDAGNLQLFRLTVKERQKLLLQAALKSLESSVLTARSGTSDEARLRKEEAELVLQWVERARKLEPLGQVLIAQSQQRDDLLLENGDVVKVPVKDGLVLINGEVLFPNAIAHESRFGIEDYVRRAGGYSQNADTSRIVVAHRDGSFTEGREIAAIRAGDEILVLPRVDTKSRQFWKDITQIIFNLAISTKVILGL